MRLTISLVLSIVAMSVLAMQPVKVATYNVRHLENNDGDISPQRVASWILANNPDVVLIQEIDSVTARSKGADQLSQLAKLTSLTPTFAAAIPFEGGSYGIGILSRTAPLSVKRIPLPGSEPRVLLIAEFTDCFVACTHLALEEEARLEAADIIIGQMQTLTKPLIIGGDWNDHPDSPLLQKLRRHFTINSPQCATFPSHHPTECLDYIATSKAFHLSTQNASADFQPFTSDHNPIVVTIF